MTVALTMAAPFRFQCAAIDLPIVARHCARVHHPFRHHLMPPSLIGSAWSCGRSGSSWAKLRTSSNNTTMKRTAAGPLHARDRGANRGALDDNLAADGPNHADARYPLCHSHNRRLCLSATDAWEGIAIVTHRHNRRRRIATNESLTRDTLAGRPPASSTAGPCHVVSESEHSSDRHPVRGSPA